ncbi:hypothetical protein [Asanoa iriomotensis]|uniref:Uncharacterized protein n=1 Tax=Asanoa iriomotensis TaxID=234613 RepID=A0ABQ4CFP9_9ACTN|nr:hypothetical protein [Asanoa iriomotensis]GIF61135.1 hypothetical protein Air01nite_72300 [Asanoa iriomotensis]
MERAELISLLTSGADADVACREALERGADFHVFTDEGGPIPASQLAPTYRRREAGIHRQGIETLGFAAAVETLETLGNQPVLLGRVVSDEPLMSFVLFLTPDTTSVLACLGVGQLPPRT